MLYIDYHTHTHTHTHSCGLWGVGAYTKRTGDNEGNDTGFSGSLQLSGGLHTAGLYDSEVHSKWSVVRNRTRVLSCGVWETPIPDRRVCHRDRRHSRLSGEIFLSNWVHTEGKCQSSVPEEWTVVWGSSNL